MELTQPRLTIADRLDFERRTLKLPSQHSNQLGWGYPKIGNIITLCSLATLLMMDSVKQSSIAQNKSKLSRAFSKVFLKSKSNDKVKNDFVKNVEFKRFDDADEKLRLIVEKAFLAKLFASVSTVKSAYAELQFAQFPYDPDGICAADKMVVSELKILSGLKQCYLKKQIDEFSPQTTLLLAEIQEQNCTLKTYDIMVKKLYSQLKVKDTEFEFLREKLVEVNKEKKVLEKRLNFSGLSLSFFVTFLGQTVESIQSFTRLLCGEMESAGWDLDSAARSIQPGVNHKFYAFESFVCSIMFDGFDCQNFSVSTEQKKQFFDRFLELKSAKAADYLAWKPNSKFARFCCKKYLNLILPGMEESLFGNLDQRTMVKAQEYPETAFFKAFSEMAKRVWLLHCLAFSFDPEASIFQVSRKTQFSEIYMEAVNEEAFCLLDGEPRVGFSVVPGFRIGKTVIQCQVYLC